ncbi:hypothetical protein ACQ4PT_034429 [Festuca glaucescens]
MGRRSLAPQLWLTVLLGLAAGALQVCGQRAASTTGFITIDCGLPNEGGYIDPMTMIPSTSDADFIDVGSNRNISAEYMKRESQLFRGYHNVRSFPDTAARSCYTLPSLVPGSKYLVRAMFRYGNYDGLEKLPVFDLYLGVNLWQTVNISQAERTVLAEVISVIPDDSVQVCLVNTGSGTPFISTLALRPLENTLYPQANATQGLVLVDRRDRGGTGNYPISDSKVWSNISTKQKIQGNVWNLRYHAPSTVLQTAITALTGSKTIEVSFATQLDNVNPILGNMSSGGLRGSISTYFGDLKDIQYLDLSYNKLTGSIPNVLAQLPALVELDLTGNQLNGSIPSGLVKRSQDGSLTLRYGKNLNLCDNNSSCHPAGKKKNHMLAVYIVVPIAAVLIIGALIVLLIFRVRIKKGPTRGINVHGHQQLENRRFTYKELEVITDNFKIVLGQGGFGPVYDGFLQNGTHVAVKLLSLSSNQGIREFLTEAQTLTKIHHKNLDSLVGYCKDGKYLALVYEHMSEGNLDDKLRGRGCNVVFLTWRQRLRIALESAQGLEYLHKACSPPFVHRDMKTSNILLNANLEAKVADFGLMKAFNHDDDTHVSTARMIGTPGYFAPEYAMTRQLTEKNDVYSFGIVLLEVITGHSAILQCTEPTHIVQWTRQHLAGGDIKEVVDARMQSDYNINGLWKAVDVALKCTAQNPAERPTMTDVATQIQECLELESEGNTNRRCQ